MAVSARLIRRRIKSVGNTKKITKAMELVSAAKMRRSVALAAAARRYSALGSALLKELSAAGSVFGHPFFRAAKPGKTLCIVIGSDRGLCGAYNASLLRAVETSMAECPDADYVTAGRHIELAMRRAGKSVIASFAGLTEAPRAASVRPIVSLARSEFVSGIYEKVFVATTAFRSALRQEPSVTQLLPLSREQAQAQEGQPTLPGTALFEPDPATVLEYALPRFLEASVYQAVLEAAASEHSARMMSMRSATDAAGEMMADLTFTLNQARQSAITSEIAEISAGRAALEG
jgi:F-type H+-transporting ATPase subunit gamma